MRNFQKTISWLIVSGLLIAVCNYWEVRNLKLAIMSSFWACVFKTPIYWIHEYVWSKSKIEPIKTIEPTVVCDACQLALQAE